MITQELIILRVHHMILGVRGQAPLEDALGGESCWGRFTSSHLGPCQNLSSLAPKLCHCPNTLNGSQITSFGRLLFMINSLLYTWNSEQWHQEQLSKCECCNVMIKKGKYGLTLTSNISVNIKARAQVKSPLEVYKTSSVTSILKLTDFYFYRCCHHQ